MKISRIVDLHADAGWRVFQAHEDVRTGPLADEIYPAIPSPGGAVSGAKTSSASSMT